MGHNEDITRNTKIDNAHHIAKLGLGTVQFGLNYGISNANGQISLEQAERILAAAKAHGVRVLDTAALYGESEKVLGQVLDEEGESQFRIVTKTASFKKAVVAAQDADVLEQTFLESLAKLKRKSVYGLLVHHCEDAMTVGGANLFERMRLLRDQGLVEKIGVSAYKPEQVDAVIEREAIDIVQVPFNALDQRFAQSGCFSRLKRLGVEIHTRSAFLQGALLTEPAALPEHFSANRWRLERFRARSADAGLSPLEASLQFVLGQSEIDCCVVGVSVLSEFMEILQACESSAPALNLTDLASDDEQLIDPRNWRR